MNLNNHKVGYQKKDMFVGDIPERGIFLMLILMECCYRTLCFVIHTRKINIHIFKNETVDKIIILYDAMYASLFSPFVSYILPSVLLELIQ